MTSFQTVASPTTRAAEQTQLARRSALNFVGLALASALQFVLLVVLSHGLGPHDAGVFFEGYAALRLLATFAALGLDVTMVRYVAHYRAQSADGKAASAVRFAVFLGGSASCAAAALVFGFAPLIAQAFGAPAVSFVLRVMVLSLPAMVIEMVLIGATRGTGSMRSFVLVDQLLDSGVRVGAVAAALVVGFGIRGVAAAYSLAAVIPLVAAFVAARRFLLARGERPQGQGREMLRFTSFQWGAIMAGVGLLWADSLLLGLWRPPADVAIYSIATRTVLVGMVFILPIGIAFQPVITRMYTLGQWAALRSMYAFATKWSTLVAAPPLIFLAAFATPLLALLYGDPYARGAWPLVFLALGQIVNAATGPCGHITTMSGRSDLVFVNSVAALALNLALNILLIPPYGMIGAGLAWGISIVAWNLIRLWQAWRILGMHPFFGWPGPVAAAVAAFVAATVLMREAFDLTPDVRLAATAVVSSAVYLAAVFGLAAFDEHDEWLPVGIARLARAVHR